jgi:hypothetical protein
VLARRFRFPAVLLAVLGSILALTYLILGAYGHAALYGLAVVFLVVVAVCSRR